MVLITKTNIKKFINSFFLPSLSGLLYRDYQKTHWRTQSRGNNHGYDKYLQVNTERAHILLDEITSRKDQESSILDIGCNCGAYLDFLFRHGYTHLTGIDINQVALDKGREIFSLESAELLCGSFDEVIPNLISHNRTFDISYTIGATLELVHPSYPIIRDICEITNDYCILFISEDGHSYPRFWEYEFSRHGFFATKILRPYNGNDAIFSPESEQTMFVFKRKSDILHS